MKVTFERLHADVQLPAYATEGAAGMDLRLRGDLEIWNGETVLVSTGLKLAIEPGYEGQIRPRSGCAMRGLTIPNAPGTIDADYRGELRILLRYDAGTERFPPCLKLGHGDRIAQLVIAPIARPEIVEGPVGETRRGAGGFGSTGMG